MYRVFTLVLISIFLSPQMGVSAPACPVSPQRIFQGLRQQSLTRKLFKYRDPKTGVMRYVLILDRSLSRREPTVLPKGERLTYRDITRSAYYSSYPLPEDMIFYPHWGDIPNRHAFSQKPRALIERPAYSYYFRMKSLRSFFDSIHERFIKQRTGQPRQDLQMVAAWIRSHFEYDLPFADIDKIRPLSLSRAVQLGRGVCRHMAVVLKMILEELGYSAHLYRVRWEEGAHVSVLVDVEGKEYIVDPLFMWGWKGKQVHITLRHPVDYSYRPLRNQQVEFEGRVRFPLRTFNRKSWRSFRQELRSLPRPIRGQNAPMADVLTLSEALGIEVHKSHPNPEAMSQYANAIAHHIQLQDTRSNMFARLYALTMLFAIRVESTEWKKQSGTTEFEAATAMDTLSKALKSVLPLALPHKTHAPTAD